MMNVGMMKKMREMLVNWLELYPASLKIIKSFNVRGVNLLIQVGNKHEIWRWKDMAAGTKEPGTIDWIDSEMKPGDVFIDIGACVGNYTIYAALRHRGLKVIAFEPEPNSFIELIKNVRLNEIDVTCFLIPISDRYRVDFLNCNPIYCRDDNYDLGHSAFIAGESNHQFGSCINSEGIEFKPSASVGMCGASLDIMVQAGIIPPPDYVKIDVDGAEKQVVQGMYHILQSGYVKSILCEINSDIIKTEICRKLEPMGFRIVKVPPLGIGNYIFNR